MYLKDDFLNIIIVDNKFITPPNKLIPPVCLEGIILKTPVMVNHYAAPPPQYSICFLPTDLGVTLLYLFPLTILSFLA